MVSFNKEARRTLATDITLYEKKNGFPSPHKYNIDRDRKGLWNKIIGGYKQTEQGAGFLSDV